MQSACPPAGYCPTPGSGICFQLMSDTVTLPSAARPSAAVASSATVSFSPSEQPSFICTLYRVAAPCSEQGCAQSRVRAGGRTSTREDARCAVWAQGGEGGGSQALASVGRFESSGRPGRRAHAGPTQPCPPYTRQRPAGVGHPRRQALAHRWRRLVLWSLARVERVVCEVSLTLRHPIAVVASCQEEVVADGEHHLGCAGRQRSRQGGNEARPSGRMCRLPGAERLVRTRGGLWIKVIIQRAPHLPLGVRH